MKFAIQITEMTRDELATVNAFLTSMGIQPATPSSPKTKQTVAELAAAAGAVPQAPAGAIPPPPGYDPFAGVTGNNAPPAPQTPPPPPPTGTELDSRGVPHNPQFHADSMRKNKDQSWAKRKGVDQAACEAWEAAFIRTAPQTPPPPLPAAQTPPPLPAAQTPPPLPAAQTPPPLPAAQTPPPLPAAPVTPPPPPAPEAPSAAEVTAKFAPHLAGQPNGVSVDPFAAPAPQTPPPPPPPAAPVEEDIPNVNYAEWHRMYMSLMTTGKLTAEVYAAIAEPLGGIEDQMKFYNDEVARSKCYARFLELAAS